MDDVQSNDTKPVRRRDPDAQPMSASGVPITPGDPRFMTRDAEGNLVNPDGSVYEPEDHPRTVHHALADMQSEIDGLVHATPSGTESAAHRLRHHLREVRGFVHPNSPQPEVSKQEAKVERDMDVDARRRTEEWDRQRATEDAAVRRPVDATG